MPAMPRRPLPSSQIAAGSGTGAVLPASATLNVRSPVLERNQKLLPFAFP